MRSLPAAELLGTAHRRLRMRETFSAHPVGRVETLECDVESPKSSRTSRDPFPPGG